MSQPLDYDDARAFLGESAKVFDAGAIRSRLCGKRVLITGAGGFIGSALARALAQLGAAALLLLDSAETGLQELASHLDPIASPPQSLIVGDIRDHALLASIFGDYRPQVVLHAAARKHVTLMEDNPIAAAATNALGSVSLVGAAAAHGVERLVMVSTDKAAAPAGIMGATKRIAELAVLMNRSATQMTALRLGNVIGSTGSVVPIMRRQIAQGGPITITDAECARFFLSVEEAVHFLLSALLVEGPSTVLVPQCRAPHRILDLATYLVDLYGEDRQKVELRIIGLRPGEKRVESMTSKSESLRPSNIGGLQHVLADIPVTDSQYRLAIGKLEAAVESRDVAALLRVVNNLVPEYRPSAVLQHLAAQGSKAKADG